MKTNIAIAALSLVGSLSAASAHPLGDGHHFQNGRWVPHGAQRYQPDPYAQPYYGQQPYAQPAYERPYQPPQYHQPAYHQPAYQQPYAPSYPAQPHYGQPQYQQPQYAPQPAYQQGGYGQGYAPQPAYHGGYYPPQPYGRADSRLPASEGLNVGYAGGPTYGRGPRRVINGVSVFAAPND